MNDISVTGLLVCATEAEAEVVRVHLPKHIDLTRAEPGCLSFEVDPTDALTWRVSERFVDEASFTAHQARTRASAWGIATTTIERRYVTVGGPDDADRPGIRAFRTSDTLAVVDLWREVGLTRPWNDPHRDIARKLTVQPQLFLVAIDDEGTLVGTIMAGYDGHRGWLNYLATSPRARGVGIARGLIEHVEEALRDLGCPKVNLQVRSTNAEVVSFYEHLGYRVDGTVDLGKRLIAD